ncbi:hypothetical protein [Peribacillus frigoritolerans]|uniref:hypothetical protein n=1 Tax=Peribacillus frigoritolerans TaxID=450367 RepID=UPI0020795D27|nr:hypothetical protein [Peribacillus frigoritolerans]USK62829.1 hypothetical protein LIT26_16310 [Peribacillus frigoritolerans]
MEYVLTNRCFISIRKVAATALELSGQVVAQAGKFRVHLEYWIYEVIAGDVYE